MEVFKQLSLIREESEHHDTAEYDNASGVEPEKPFNQADILEQLTEVSQQQQQSSGSAKAQAAVEDSEQVDGIDNSAIKEDTGTGKADSKSYFITDLLETYFIHENAWPERSVIF